ncbi:MAG: hypothetical protein KZY61_06605 [Clostridiaceae bacterium]|nr:hypothetical protein [Clostridiaceae bacterium]MBW4860402.1 hypothetical protein [Clostridiaceae bacterium]MBW4868318.1 hypothetical protein [Clostridiaceae bacterium]
MIKLFFGNIPTILSTGLIVVFVIFLKDVLSKDPQITRWGTLALRMFLLGFIMSAMSGAKDYSGIVPVIKFGPGNKAFIVLSVLGGIGILFGIWAFISKNKSVHRTIFYALSVIIIIKTVIVEVMRIKKHFIG